MSTFALLCWIFAFLNMVSVFVQLSIENYLGAGFNFLVSFSLIYQRVNQSQPTEFESE